MARENRLVMLLDDHESEVIDSWARIEKLPASTLARRFLLMAAEQRGIVPRYGEKHNRAGAVVEAVPSAIAG